MNLFSMMCELPQTHSHTKRFIAMKYSRKNVERKAYAIPNIKFEQQQLTSFAGLVILRPFLATLGLTAGLAGCFRHLRAGKVYGRATVFLQLPPCFSN